MRAFLFATLMLVGCASPAAGGGAPQAQLPEHIRMDLEQRDAALRAPGVRAASIGQTIDFGMGLTLRPLEVTEDSRCPQNARCVWAGRLRVRVDVSGSPAELTLDEPLMTPYGSVTLVAVSPGPWTDWPEGARPAYRFGFRHG